MRPIRRVYVSCPMSVPQTELDKVLKHLKSLGVAACAWERGTPYTDDPVRYCDAFIIMLPDNKFNYEVEKLPTGTKNELKLAINFEKPVYLAYLPIGGLNHLIYCTNIEPRVSSEDFHILGLQGTSRNFLENIDSYNADQVKYNALISYEECKEHKSNSSTIEIKSLDLRSLLLTI